MTVETEGMTEGLLVRWVPPLLYPGLSPFVYLADGEDLPEHLLQLLPLASRQSCLKGRRDLEDSDASALIDWSAVTITGVSTVSHDRRLPHTKASLSSGSLLRYSWRCFST